MSDGTCQWSDPGETCSNEASHVVTVEVGWVVYRFPACEDCIDEDVETAEL